MLSDWREVFIEDIKASTENALAAGPFGSAISAKYFQSRGVPVIRGGNLSEDIHERMKDEGLVFVSEKKATEFKRSTAIKGDLIFTCWGTVGQVGLIDYRCRYSAYVISNKQMKLTPDPDKADSLFLYYAFSGPVMQHRIRSQAIGSSVPGFNLGQLRNLRILLPPLSEQRAIARILGTLDDKIELNRRMNHTLEGIASAIFKSWFVDFDPVVAKADRREPFGMDAETAALFPEAFVGSPQGQIPEGWRSIPLPKVFEVNPTRPLRKGELAPYLDMGNMPTQGHSPAVWTERPFGSGMRFQNGDTLVARITPCLENGKTAFVDFLADGQIGWGSTEYIVLRPKKPIPPAFAYFLARSNDFRDFAIANMTGSSGRQRVPAESLDKFYVTVATHEVCAAFGRVVEPLMARAAANVAEARTLAEVRDTLLPKLLSGEIGVKQAEEMLAAV